MKTQAGLRAGLMTLAVASLLLIIALFLIMASWVQETPFSDDTWYYMFLVSRLLLAHHGLNLLGRLLCMTEGNMTVMVVILIDIFGLVSALLNPNGIGGQLMVAGLSLLVFLMFLVEYAKSENIAGLAKSARRCRITLLTGLILPLPGVFLVAHTGLGLWVALLPSAVAFLIVLALYIGAISRVRNALGTRRNADDMRL